MLNWLFKRPPADPPRLCLGLMSGTSLDGLDACLAEYHADGELHIVETDSRALPDTVRERLERMVTPNASVNLSELLAVEVDYTAAVSAQCDTLIKRAPRRIDCIGFHGQTLWHAPGTGNTLQIGMAEHLRTTRASQWRINFAAAIWRAAAKGRHLHHYFTTHSLHEMQRVSES